MKSIHDIICEKFYNNHKNNEWLLSPEDIIKKSNGFFNIWSSSPHFQLVGLRNENPYFGFKSGIYVKYWNIIFLTGRGDDDYFEIDLEFRSYEIEKLVYSENKISFENWRGLKSIKCHNKEIKLVKEFIEFYKSEKALLEKAEREKKREIDSEKVSIEKKFDPFTGEVSFFSGMLDEKIDSHTELLMWFEVVKGTDINNIKLIFGLNLRSRYSYGSLEFNFSNSPQVFFLLNSDIRISVNQVLDYSTEGDPSRSYTIHETLKFLMGKKDLENLRKARKIQISARGKYNLNVDLNDINLNRVKTFFESF